MRPVLEEALEELARSLIAQCYKERRGMHRGGSEQRIREASLSAKALVQEIEHGRWRRGDALPVVDEHPRARREPGPVCGRVGIPGWKPFGSG
jgi:hypothetical protein